MVLPPSCDTLDALAFGILSRTERDEGEEIIAAVASLTVIVDC